MVIDYLMTYSLKFEILIAPSENSCPEGFKLKRLCIF